MYLARDIDAMLTIVIATYCMNTGCNFYPPLDRNGTFSEAAACRMSVASSSPDSIAESIKFLNEVFQCARMEDEVARMSRQ